MIDQSALLVAHIRAYLKQSGFKVRGNTSFKEGDGIVFVVNIQKSQYGPVYYINTAAFIGTLESRGFIPEYKCDIRSRIDNHLEPELASILSSALDLTKQFDFNKRISTLTRILFYRIDFLIKVYSKIPLLVDYINSKDIRVVLINAEARRSIAEQYPDVELKW